VARASHLRLFAIPPPDIRGLVLDHDLVFVGGGNTANMLAVWPLHGLDEVLHEAWRAGVVLAGVSAGAICWFEAGVTDSFRADLDGLECLGFLPGSACPHYDGEEARRPAYHRLVREGFPPGVAVDDGCGLVFRDTELVDVVSERDGARAYRVELAGGEVREEPLHSRLLT
jgi:peptidase E